jgi:hypothetical membrane protein
MNITRKLSFYSSMIAAGCYALFTLLALIKYPAAYSPLNNWLSDLGSYTLNPRGAIFYNLGIVVAGVSIALFFFGLSPWRKSGNKLQNIMLLLAQICGTLGALSMLLSALFPINIKDIHSFLSASLYILIGSGFVFSVAAFWYYSKYPRWLLIFGIFVALEDILWGLILNIFIIEWLTVALFLFYILLVGFVTNRNALYLQE